MIRVVSQDIKSSRETIADLGYIKLYAKDVKRYTEKPNVNVMLDRIIELADSCLRRVLDSGMNDILGRENV
jgi:hypothetical protein